jgi:2-(1,2-epoxy-1,2-dihydrophenyl)acetyl-CoA isomerase
MTYQFATYSVEQGVATLVLDRPDVLNSFTRPMAAEVQQALDLAAADAAVRAILLTGAGRGFCAGQDLGEALPGGDVPGPPIEQIVRETYNPIIRRLRAIEKPIVCAVNGVAAGAGANIALACDIVVAADSASFVQAFSRIGLVPDSGGTFFLPRLVGMQRATAMMMLGDKVTANEALALGMIYRVVPLEQLMPMALDLARRLAAMPTRGLGLTKRALNASLANDLDAQLDLEARLQAEAGATDDFREQVAAFLAKRPAAQRGGDAPFGPRR